MGTTMVDERSHHEVAESVVLGRESERRDLRWWELARQTLRRRRRRGAQARAWTQNRAE
jgi:hypothetical protein